MAINTKTTRSLNQVFNIDDSYLNDDQKSTEIVPATSTAIATVGDDCDDQISPTDQQQWKQEDDEIKSATERDYQTVRDNLHDLLDQGSRMLELAIQVAEGTENPKSIEAASKIIGQLADINTRLIDINAKKQDVYIKTRPKVSSKFAQAVNGEVPPNMVGNVTNNTLFVGSVSDLLNQLRTIDTQQQVIDNDKASTN